MELHDDRWCVGLTITFDTAVHVTESERALADQATQAQRQDRFGHPHALPLQVKATGLALL